uniref:V-SNARE coiled-coil homology domain-containing protein n=1 Tax=Esox lucius TaxID=8010 RepID=A0A3P8Z2V0_ESOLU
MSTPDAGTPGAPGAPEGDGGPAAPAPNLTSNRRLQQTQAQVDEVVDIMRVNVDKVLERDQRLSELDDRADALQAGASQFESSAAKLKNKYWWKNLKVLIVSSTVYTAISDDDHNGNHRSHMCWSSLLVFLLLSWSLQGRTTSARRDTGRKPNPHV